MKNLLIASLALWASLAHALSPLPDTEWEIDRDSEGYPIMMNSDDKNLVLFSLGYQESKDCGDIKMMIANVVPEPDEEYSLDDYQGISLPSYMTIPSVPNINLPAAPVSFLETQGENVIMLYTYTPSDKLLIELMNTEVFFWRDDVFKDGSYAGFNNEGFVESLNEVTRICYQRITSTDM